MRIAIVGCGYVADSYLQTLPNHPELELAGVTDRDGDRASRFAAYHSTALYRSLEDVLEDRSVDIVVNLTNPRSHFTVSKACLEAGFHVYSEKPLAMVFPEAEELVDLAERCGLYLASAPCSILGECAQTLWKALREDKIGRVRLVYADLDDGLIHRMPYRTWRSESGSPWPYKDEWEVGCTIEHAGYYVTWLTAFFGPAKTVASFSSCLIPDKQTDEPLDTNAPDFSAATIQFASGVVARLTCSIIAPRDHSLRIIGDEGLLSTDDCWDYGSPVYITRTTPLTLRLENHPAMSTLLGLGPKKYPLVKKPDLKKPRLRYPWKIWNKMDFCRGVAELGAAVAEGRPCRLSARYALHVNEIVLTVQNPEAMGSPRAITSSFDSIDPMPWAKA